MWIAGAIWYLKEWWNMRIWYQGAMWYLRQWYIKWQCDVLGDMWHLWTLKTKLHVICGCSNMDSEGFIGVYPSSTTPWIVKVQSGERGCRTSCNLRFGCRAKSANCTKECNAGEECKCLHLLLLVHQLAPLTAIHSRSRSDPRLTSIQFDFDTYQREYESFPWFEQLSPYE